MEVRIGGTNDFSLIDGIGISFIIYFQGCVFNCKGCHNPELQPLEGGSLVDIDSLLYEIFRNKDAYNSVVYQGGEPTVQKKQLLYIMKAVRGEGLLNVLYTGLEYDSLDSKLKELSDLVIAGKYEQSLATNSFPASSNQKIIRR